MLFILIIFFVWYPSESDAPLAFDVATTNNTFVHYIANKKTHLFIR
jgi:hypothetical protein